MNETAAPPAVISRGYDQAAYARLVAQHVHPVMARIYAARGISSNDDLDITLGSLLPVNSLQNCEQAASRLADAIVGGQRLLIVADYDADGATACALGVSVLRGLGADIDYLVPNRFEHGYGLTPEIVDLAATRKPRLIITVDNGIASVDGVARAAGLGIEVLITDHHLPGEKLPQAACIVNPNQTGDSFASKHLAGVGVMFYVLLALRAELRKRGWFSGSDSSGRDEPNLADQLDLVALGTVADVVRLDKNNRTLVSQGLNRMRRGRVRPGIAALFEVAGRDSAKASAYDLGFMLAPRLNAAGRLTDMTLGIECLLSTESSRALELASQLDALNRERREVEAQMQASASELIDGIEVSNCYGLALYDPQWHHGVVGILASRLRERYHRPVIALAPASDTEAKGSGRSIPGLHLRDALDLLTKRYPGLIRKFGGHAMAAGLTVRLCDLDAFADAFDAVVRSLLKPEDLQQRIETDGSLAPEDCSMQLAEMLDQQVWGQGFAPPTFCDSFEVRDQRVVGGRHRKLRLARPGMRDGVEAIQFGETAALPGQIRCVYRLGVNEFNGNRIAQLIVEHCAPISRDGPWN